jgi:hypothetical protein
MPDSAKVSSDGAGVEENPPNEKDGIVREQPIELQDHGKVQAEVGQESFGAPPDDEIKYVKGYPVIRSGECSQQPIPSAANTDKHEQEPMFLNSLFLFEMMGTLH